MAIRLMSAAFLLEIPPTDKLVLIALADSANDEGACFPSLRYLMRKTSLCERSLRIVFGRLESRGLLRREYRSGRSTVYWVDEAGFLESRGEFRAPLSSGTPASGAGVTPASGAGVTPASGAPTPASGAPTPASGAPTPASGAPISVSYPSPIRQINSEGRTVKNDGAGTRRPSAGGFSEGGAKAPPPGTPRPSAGGGSTAKPSTLHVSQEPPASELSLEQRRANIARLRDLLR